MIKERFKCVSRKFQGSVNSISRVLGSVLRGFEATSRRVSKQFLSTFRMVLIKFQGGSKILSRMFQRSFKEGNVMKISKVFQRSPKLF